MSSMPFFNNPASMPKELDPLRQNWEKTQKANQDQIMQGNLMKLMGPTQTDPYGNKSLTQGYQPSMFFGQGNRRENVTGEHMLRAIEQDHRAAAEAERNRYKGMQDAIGRIRSSSEAGAKAVEQAGLQDLMKAKQFGESMVPLADKAFQDMQKQYSAAQNQYNTAMAQAQGSMRGAMEQYGDEAERQKAAMSQALAQQSQERKDQTAAQMGGAVPGTQDQFAEAGRQIDQYADQLKFKSFADIDADRAKTLASLQSNLAGMQMQGAQFGAGLAQQSARDQFSSAQSTIQARQVASSIYQFSAQQSAQAAQIASQLRMNGEVTSATFLERNPQHPVSMARTLMAAMQAQRSIPTQTYGVFSGMQQAPQQFAPRGGMPGFTPMPTPPTAQMPSAPIQPTKGGGGLNGLGAGPRQNNPLMPGFESKNPGSSYGKSPRFDPYTQG